jgi:choice-of-anchor B domain-containing protein
MAPVHRSRALRLAGAVLACAVVLAWQDWQAPALAHEGDPKGEIIDFPPDASEPGTIYSSLNVFQLSHLSLAEIGGLTPVRGSGSVHGNDIWGWTDPLTGKEYALAGRTDGTAFVDVSDPVNPQYLGILPSATGNSAWRDVKVYQDHAYIVSDRNELHGLQIFDLTQLRSVAGPPVTFTETAHGSTFTTAHNIAINEQSGYAYVVGSSQASGGLHILSLSNPESPTFVANYSGDGYTHDVQVVNYNGPDTAYQGHEIAFASNEDTLTIVDVTNKAGIVQLSRTTYPNASYTHQGWLSEDQHYFFSDDELDEYNNRTGGFTRTHVWRLDDLNTPQYVGYFQHPTDSIDHNLYIKNGLVYESDYTTGLRVLDLDLNNIQVDANQRITSGVSLAAWIDTYPTNDAIAFNGTWSNYPYFDSGTIIIQDIDNGLIVAQLTLLAGDTNTDRMVDMNDLQVVADHFNTAVDAGFMEGDFDLNGFVDFGDLALMAPNWLTGVANGPTFTEALTQFGLAPEPASLLLVGLPAGVLLGQRRRGRRTRLGRPMC